MKKYRAKIIIRAKETDFEIIESENIHRAADMLVNRYLPPMGIDNPKIEVFFDQDFKG